MIHNLELATYPYNTHPLLYPLFNLCVENSSKVIGQGVISVKDITDSFWSHIGGTGMFIAGTPPVFLIGSSTCTSKNGLAAIFPLAMAYITTVFTFWKYPTGMAGSNS